MATSIAEILNVRLPAMIFAYARKRLGIINAVSKDFSTDPGQKGAIIPWGVARGVSAAPISPGPYRASTSNLAQDAGAVTLSNYMGVPLTWTDTNQMFQQIEQTEAPALVAAANTIADNISQSIWTAIAAAKSTNFVSCKFSSNMPVAGGVFDYAFLQNLSQAADAAQFTPANRVIVANTTNILDMGKDTSLNTFFAFNAALTRLFATGQPANVLDWNFALDINQPTVQIVGDGVGYTVSTSYTIGATSIVTASGTTAGGTAFKVGDLITIDNTGGGAADYNVYQIISVSGATTTWTLGLATPATSSSATPTTQTGGGGSYQTYNPAGGLLVAHNATDKIAVIAARGGTGGMTNALAVNGQGPVAFDPLGVLLAMRMPPAAVLGKKMLADPAFVKDEVTGMPLALYAYEEYHQVTIEVCYINGVGVRSELVIPIVH
jgi:hypothetical protein